MAEGETSVATLLGGRLCLRQPATGHRAGTDAVLLAAAASIEAGLVVADVGAGVGTIGLALALREPGVHLHLIERDQSLAALATENARRNGVEGQAVVHVFDLFDRKARSGLAGRCDLVVSNPPFYLAGHGRLPQSAKQTAYWLDDKGAPQGHGDWLQACLSLLRPNGRLILVHRPDALPALLAASDRRLGAVAIRPVFAKDDSAAIRILFGGVKASRAALRILPPLVLHQADGRFTPLGEALHRGEIVLPLFDAQKSRPRGPASALR